MRRRDAESAIAKDDRCDSVSGRNSQDPVPENLCVVMGVDIDEAGSDGEAGGVDRAGRAALNFAQGSDFTRLDRHVAPYAGLPGAVNNGSAAYFQIVIH